jgi:hypothetical protein
MNGKQVVSGLLCLASCAGIGAQQANQLQLKIDSTNRTLTVSAEERVPSVSPVSSSFAQQRLNPTRQ